jgi:hypothetical protein
MTSGCGGSSLTTAEVTGKVTLKGRPVTQGKVLFRPEKGPMAAGNLESDGSYTLTTYRPGDGAIVGKCAVAIAAPTYGAPVPGAPPDIPPPRDETIPTRFHNFGSSGLIRMVDYSDNVFDFELSEL